MEYQILNNEDDILTLAASLDDTEPHQTIDGILIRKGLVHGVETITFDIGGKMIVVG